MLIYAVSIAVPGSQNKALANEILILQPPENSFVVCFCIAWLKPKPAKIVEALWNYC